MVILGLIVLVASAAVATGVQFLSDDHSQLRGVRRAVLATYIADFLLYILLGWLGFAVPFVLGQLPLDQVSDSPPVWFSIGSGVTFQVAKLAREVWPGSGRDSHG